MKISRLEPFAFNSTKEVHCHSKNTTTISQYKPFYLEWEEGLGIESTSVGWLSKSRNKPV
jgi:hypothetical protein